MNWSYKSNTEMESLILKLRGEFAHDSKKILSKVELFDSLINHKPLTKLSATENEEKQKGFAKTFQPNKQQITAHVKQLQAGAVLPQMINKSYEGLSLDQAKTFLENIDFKTEYLALYNDGSFTEMLFYFLETCFSIVDDFSKPKFKAKPISEDDEYYTHIIASVNELKHLKPSKTATTSIKSVKQLNERIEQIKISDEKALHNSQMSERFTQLSNHLAKNKTNAELVDEDTILILSKLSELYALNSFDITAFMKNETATQQDSLTRYEIVIELLSSIKIQELVSDDSNNNLIDEMKVYTDKINTALTQVNEYVKKNGSDTAKCVHARTKLLEHLHKNTIEIVNLTYVNVDEIWLSKNGW
ncbi:hypothetical protein NB550_07515 [Vibrio parahaemolyticus]|uniref:hypothetical protein n=1 Tax=Vibrio parahaemolyticus TaxID=670 RepID=UPI00215D1533|nr:hypothetical protein [Vibrio parahaemolyticus]EKH9208441.1 hypothetical protein [Vibrio parahaemolyticus]MCR9891919.1 hypothetical protein [Vibrio parahaemolyticus]MCR9917331.1 hypothetical protein [Vibrio parahaemolyticus]